MQKFFLLLALLASLARAEESRTPVYLTVGPGVSRFAELWGATLYFGALRPVYGGLLVGIDGAATVWNVQGGDPSQFARFTFMSLHLLPAAVYRFRLGESVAAHVGVSAGPHVFLGSFNFKTKEQQEVFQTGTGVTMEWLLRAGMHFSLTPKVALTVEPEVGRLLDNTVFFPKAAFTVAL